MTLDRTLATSNSILAGRAEAQAVRIADGLRFASLEEALNEIRASSIDGDVTQHFIDLLTERADGLLNSAADNLASEALALGRHDEAEVFKGDIEECVYTSLLDANTCDPCAAADGTTVEFGSAEYEALNPPYRECEGGLRCRCQFVFTLKTEAPAGPISLQPLEPLPPFRPIPTVPLAPLPTPVTPEPVLRPAPLPGPALPAPIPVSPTPVARPVVETPRAYAQAVKAVADRVEPSITADVQAIARQTRGSMTGLDFRIKRIESLERKIATEIPVLNPETVAARINDSVRYTTLYSPTEYAQRVREADALMRSRGYTLIARKNYWDPARRDYMGINTVWQTPDGVKFEMQYHTPYSIYVKERLSHPLYERLRVSTDLTERQRLEDEIARVWGTVPIPRGALDIR